MFLPNIQTVHIRCPSSGGRQARQYIEQGGLSCPVVPQNCRDLSLIDAQLYVVDGLNFSSSTVPKRLLESHDPDCFFVLELTEKIIDTNKYSLK